MDNINTTFFLRILFFIFVFCGQFAQAQVVRAGEFFWKHQQANIYEIGLAIYRHCNGAMLDSTQTIEIIATDLSPTDSLFVDLKWVSSDIVSFHCDTVQNICGELGSLDSTNQGLEKQVFTAIIDFGQGKLSQLQQNGACVFRFYFQNYQRAFVATLDSSQKASSFTVDAELNLCGVKKAFYSGIDHSPLFTNPPLVYSNCNSLFSYHDGGFDKDGDSVVYSLEAPLWNKQEEVTYAANYSNLFPVKVYCRFGTSQCNCRQRRPIEGFCFDPFLGSYTYYPTNCGESSLIVIKATQYKLDSTGHNWIYAGYTKREFNLKTIYSSFSNNSPMIYDLSYPTLCEGERVCMQVHVEDEEFATAFGTQPWKDTIQMTWNQVFKDATFEVDSHYTVTTNGVTVVKRSAKLCFQTQVGDARPMPYIFSVTASDKYCPYKGVTAKAFAFLVKPAPEFKVHITGNPCGNYQMKLNSIKKFPFRDSIIAVWKVLDEQDDVVAQGNKTSDSFKLNEFGTYRLQTTAYHYRSNCNVQTIDTIYFAPDSLQRVLISPMINSNETLQCFKEHQFDLSANATIKNDSIVAQFWTFSDNESDTFWQTSVSKRLDSVGSVQAFLHVSSYLGCLEKAAKSLVVVPNPTAMLAFEDTVLCFKQHKFFGNIDSNDSQSQLLQYLWSFSDSPDSFLTGNTVAKRFHNPGKYKAQLVAIDSNLCSDTASLFLEALPVIQSSIGIVDSGENAFCSPAKINFFAQNDTFYNAFVSGYLWEFSNQLFSNDSVVEGSFNADTGHYAQLVTETNNGCFDTSTLFFKVYSRPKAQFEFSDSVVCLGENVFLIADSSTLSNQFFWNVNLHAIGSGSQMIFDADKDGDYEVQLVVKSKEQCTDTFSRILSVTPRPSAKIHMLSPTDACSNNAFFEMIDSSSISLGSIVNNTWRFSDSMVVNENKVAFNPNQEGTYNVFLEVLSNQGCTGLDSVVLNVKHSPTVLPIIGDSLFYVDDTITYLVQENLFYTYEWKHSPPFGYHINSNNQASYTVFWTDTGWAQVSYIVYADPACSDSAFLNVYIQARNSTSNRYPEFVAPLSFYPNPVIDKLMLPEWENIVILTLYNNEGKRILNASPEPQLDLSFLTPGTYIVEGISKNGSLFRSKIVKINP